MSIYQTEDLSPTERVALVVKWMLEEGQLSNAQAREITGLTRFGAWRLLNRLARVMPIYFDEEQRLWTYLDN